MVVGTVFCQCQFLWFWVLTATTVSKSSCCPPPDVQHRGRHPGPDELERGVRRRERPRRQGDGVRLADLHRRRGAVPVEDAAEPQDHRPLRARRPAVPGRGRPAQAAEEGAKLLADAKKQIQVEKANALLDIRAQVADLSIQVAEKLVARELEKSEAQTSYISELLDDVERK